MEGTHNIELCEKNTCIILIPADFSGWVKGEEKKKKPQEEKCKKARRKKPTHTLELQLAYTW